MKKTILITKDGKILEYLHIDFTMDEWKNKTVEKLDAIVTNWCKKNNYDIEKDKIEWVIYY